MQVSNHHLLPECPQNPPSLAVESLTQNINKVTYTANFAGNLTFSMSDDGILLVDTGTQAVGEHLLKELKKFQGKKVKVIINTHFHQDHTSGNLTFVPFAKIIGHKNNQLLLTSGDKNYHKSLEINPLNIMRYRRFKNRKATELIM